MEIIDCWNKLTIDKWQQAVALEGVKLDNFDKGIELLKLLSNLSENEIHNLTMQEYNRALSKLSFINHECSEKLKDEFEILGVKYIVSWRIESRTAGQMIDLTQLTKEPELINQNLHNILAVLCHPKDERYETENYLNRSKLFQDHMTMDIALPMSVFFYKILADSLPIIADYLKETTIRTSKELSQQAEKVHLENIGDGM